MKKYNHAYTLAFSLESNNEGENVTEIELLTAIARRLADLIESKEVIEATGLPYDTYENGE
jgi:hypothetical protein